MPASKKIKSNQEMDAIERIFNALDTASKGFVTKKVLLDALHDRGILEDDTRVRQTTEALKKYKEQERITFAQFRPLVAPHITLIEKALTGGLVIPDFKNFTSFLTNLYNRTLQNKSGHVSEHITELANIDPDNYALSVCTVHGQRFNIGDYQTPYLARSTAKPINYCIALQDNDEARVHKKIGRAPKENGFDYLMLNTQGLPHNPLNGAGTLMLGTMISPRQKPANRFTYIKEMWKALSGGIAPGFNERAYTQEKRVADADRALAYFMQQKGLFSKGEDIEEHLDFFWKCLCIETTTEAQSVIAATLANAGVCPTNEQEVVKSDTTRNCLSLVAMCGMKEYSSEYFFSIGLPAQSGTSGVVLIVVPDVMGIAVWSPRVDDNGNSEKGLDFSRKLVERFNFHTFGSAIKNMNRVDPRLKKNEMKMKGVMAVTAAASIGDVDELQRLYAAGVDLNEGEYDKRTGIHLAASEGHVKAVQFFIEKQVDINPKDRWGGTPLADAKREGHKDVLALLRKHGGVEKA